jgi:SAM-dependent methyltransferase
MILMQIKEPLEEKSLKNSIKSIKTISDNVSKKVRDQYEENPYPRWRYINKNIASNFLLKLNNDIKPNKVEFNNNFLNPTVLIAGCGTGKQLVEAISYNNSNVVGVDLSLTSLAYAIRKIDEIGYKNIEFLQGDILHLKDLKRKFDVIECVGVLHHMKDPLAGLKVLLDILKPHGFLKLGLYSEISRQHIVGIKEFIKKKKFKTSIKDIRNCRESIVNQNKNKLFQKVINNFDFYSTSSTRDLIFDVQEHQFTIPKISKILDNFNLEFLGFTNSHIKKKFSETFPDDKRKTSLNNWNQFEIENPDAFIGMYQFWVRKIKKI